MGKRNKKYKGPPQESQKEETVNTVSLPSPDKSIFRYNLNDVTKVTQERNFLYVLDRVEYPESGGVFTWLRGVPYPTKGFPTPESVGANNQVKRMLMTSVGFFGYFWTVVSFGIFILIPWKKKIAVFRKWAEGFCRFSKSVMQPYYLVDNRYTPLVQEAKSFLYQFFLELGVDKQKPLLAYWIAKSLAVTIEYDDAYRYRIEDILSETTAEKLSKNPRKEVIRLGKIFQQREPKTHLQKKFSVFVQIISLILWIPRVRRAFRTALSRVDFTRMQLDTADRYHVLKFTNYQFMGIPWEQRKKIYSSFHTNGFPPRFDVINNTATLVDDSRTYL